MTSFINSEVSGNKEATFVLTGMTTGTDTNDFGFYSREEADTSKRPVLEVTYTTPATVASVGVPANGTYGVGQNLDFTVNYSEAVTVTGTPYIPITLDTGGTVNASYVGGSGSTDLVFRYTVQSGNLDTNGVSVGGSINLNGGTIKNGTENASLTLNSMGSTAAVLVDGVAPTVSSAALAASNAYIDVTFDEGVYGASDGATALTAAKLALTFTQSGGTATNAVINSVKRNDNIAEGSASALTGGETTVRVFLTVTGIPSGAETIEIKPADGASVYDMVGNAMSILQTTGAKNLNDQTPPTLAGAARTDDTHITVALSKNCTNITKANDGGFTVEESGFPGTTYVVSAIAQGVDASHVVLTVANMGVSAKEGVTVKYTAGGNGTVQDTAGNALATDGAGVAVAAWDTTSPTITAASLASTNAYIDVTFDEGVYGATDGATALTAAKLALTFTRNGGTATNAVISSVKQNDNIAEGPASALAGGETTVRVFLTMTGTPSGVETIEVKPADGAAIYDKAGNAMSALQTTGVKNLNDQNPPTLVSAARTDDTHITVTLSKNCVNIAKANDGGFTVEETGAPGTAYAVSAIAQGADASHVVLTVANMGVSAKEGVTVKYTAGGNGTVQDAVGNALATDGAGVVVAAWDTASPTITAAALASTNAYIDVTFDESVYGANDGSTVLTAAKFALTFTRNGGTATNVVISSVKQNDNIAEGSASALAGGETIVRVFLTMTGTPSGVETIEVKPADGAAIYDKAGNAMADLQTTGIKTLNDQNPPTLAGAARTDDTHITVTLSKSCVNITKANDGGFTVEETGAPGTTYAVSAIAQGADAGHVVLTVANLGISAKEGVTVKYTASGNGTVQDTPGNPLATDGVGVAVAAWDTASPAMSSTALDAGNAYLDITFSEGVYGAGDGSSALTAAKLALTFTQNAGTATNAAISSVKKNDGATEGSASALAGGETTVRVFLTVTGTPSGAETIEIKPAGGASIYDKAGNAMADLQTTGVKALNDQNPPILAGAARTDDTHITVTLSKNCVNITKANDGGFTVEETGAPGTPYAVSAIAQGVDAGHVVLTVASLGISAKEGVTVKYTAGGNGSVQDTAGNALATDGVGVVVLAWDTASPDITGAALASTNAYIDVTFDDGVYGATDGTTALTAAEFALTFTQNTGAATNAAISSVKKNDSPVEGSASALTGGETTVRVFLTVTGTPSGAETIEIKPAGGAAIYDKAGNAMVVLQTTGVKTLNNQNPPPPPPPLLAVTTGSLPDGTEGVLYGGASLAASGGTPPYTWSAAGLPAGLGVSSAGVISGIPSEPGTFIVTITVWDSGGYSASANLSLTVSRAAAPVLLSAATNATGTKITLIFDKAMADPRGKHDSFTVIAGGTVNKVISAALNTDPAEIDLTLASAANSGESITISYTPGSLAAADGGLLAAFAGQAVNNRKAYIEYSKDYFKEAEAGDGSIDNTTPLEITLVNGTFSGGNGDDFIRAGKLNISNLPAGLSGSALRADEHTLLVTLTGKAVKHSAEDSISNLALALRDIAFMDVSAAGVSNSSKNDFSITFIDPVAVRSLKLNPRELTLAAGGEPVTLEVEIVPADAANVHLVWSSSKPKVATVDESGTVTPVSTGSAIIEVKTADGKKSDTCRVTVKKAVAVRTLKLDPQSLTLAADGEAVTLEVEISPADAANVHLVWSSSKPKVATVDENGTVTPVSTGSAIIEVATEDGKKSDTCRVTVKKSVPVRTLKLDPQRLTLTADGEAATLEVEILPAGASNVQLIWSSSKPKVATVDENGTVTPVSAGTAIIEVTTEDGKKSDTCRVTVKKAVAVKDIKLNKSRLTLKCGDPPTALVAKVIPDDATNKEIIWTSTKPEVATVDDKGVVTPVSAGSTTIKAATLDGKESAACKVTVKKR
ncbi:surface adhesion protein [Desulfocucumis palustris]|uniref:Surface adhesion protein n=1 Tax=Desulfocucumis palustris TaxID=1898651 RepID=A0A2L2X7W9_9FIRM|nr:surface adhesion protein [Desulfocucumis palustris]